MNKERRNKLAVLRGNLEDLAADLEALAGEERDAFDNMPESLQQGERGQQTEAAADALDEAVSELQTALNNIEQASE